MGDGGQTRKEGLESSFLVTLLSRKSLPSRLFKYLDPYV
jgi:hypothetical protein